MPRKDDLERYENTAARDILPLLEALRPAPDVQAPPYFRAQVLARIAQQQGQRGWRVRLFQVLTPAWVPVLAVGLLLSLGVNVWLGFRSLGPGDGLVRRSDLEPGSRDWGFDTSTFQATIQSETTLGALVTAHSSIGTQAVTYGFAARPAAAQGFTIGVLYAEALASLRSAEVDSAMQRLDAIETELTPGQGAEVLDAYLRKLRSLLESEAYPPNLVGEFLAFFELLFTEHLLRTGADEQLPLFRAGIWLASMSLAAAAGDQAALRQGNVVPYFQQEMTRLHAPEGVLKALEQLHHLLGKAAMTERDITEVLKLVKRLQTLLG